MNSKQRNGKIIAFATQGAGGDDEARLRALLERTDAEFFPFDARDKRGSFRRLLRALKDERPSLVVMEGTGLAGGLALIIGKKIYDIPYVVSSGDAVAPFIATRSPALAPLFGLYERTLYRYSSGFIGWTPYLVGRALTYGAPRAMTAAGWTPYPRSPDELREARARVRAALNIGESEIVIGLVGSLAWTSRFNYCYGLELVRAAVKSKRTELRVVIVGDGAGRERLADAAGEELGKRVLLVGRVERAAVPDYLAAMDAASLPQSVDGVGSFRYTTKLSEYLAAGAPIITGEIPLAYDLDSGWLWRLPGDAPWDARYIDALARWMETVTPEEIEAKRRLAPRSLLEFDRESQIERTAHFIQDLMETSDRVR